MIAICRFGLASVLLLLGTAAYGLSIITTHVVPRVADRSLRIRMDNSPRPGVGRAGEDASVDARHLLYR